MFSVCFITILLVIVLLSLLYETDSKKDRVCLLIINGKVFANSKVVITSSWINRRIGLLNHGELGDLRGLFLKNTSSVTTKGMLFPIDLVYTDKHNNVLLIKKNIQPGSKKIAGPKMTTGVLELSAFSTSNQLNLKVGDKVGFLPTEN